MKNAMQKDFWREIQHTRSRFFSMMILVALSVAFLSGLKATAPDMKKTGDDYLDSLHLADIQVLSTLGLTDDDITSLRAQDKVEDAEGEYVIDAFASSDSLDAVVKVLSLTSRGINEVLLRDGRMPARADECVVEENMLSLMSISIGDTICSPDNPVPIEFQKISEPTIAMQFVVNDSPFAGQEGKFVTSRHLRDRLFRELNTDVSLRVEETDNTDSFKVSGRGELHLSVLVENMRREGYEFAVSKAEVLYKKDENGKQLEPMETVYIDVPDEFTGIVIDKLSQRKGELRNMGMSNGGYTRLEFSIPSRGLIGYRGEFLTDTKGNGIMNTAFDCYAPYKGDIQYRSQGSLIAFETGEAVAYGLFNAQDRGTLFIGPGEKVYSGMVIGQNAKTDDIELNVCKTKHLTNTRSSSADEALKLTPPRILSLEEALDFIDTDELLEVTPKSLRIRKKILDPKLRKRSNFQ